MIWNSRWVTAAGIIESREAFALPASPHVVTVLRRIHSLDGANRLRAVLNVRAKFGAETMRGTHRSKNGTWTGRSGPLWFRWSGVPKAHRAGAGPLVAELDIGAGNSLDLVLELSDQPLEGEAPDPRECWSATEAAWNDAVPDLGHGVLGPRDAEMAMAVLNGLTSCNGGMVAATMSPPPERARANCSAALSPQGQGEHPAS